MEKHQHNIFFLFPGTKQQLADSLKRMAVVHLFKEELAAGRFQILAAFNDVPLKQRMDAAHAYAQSIGVI